MSVLDGPGEGTWSVFAAKVVEEREELLHKIAGEAAHIKSLEGLLVDALRERDALHGAMTVRYSLSREIEEIFGVTGAEASDEQLALGVAAARRIVRQRDEALYALDSEKMARYGREMDALDDLSEARAEVERLRERLAVERTPNGAGKWNAERVLRERAERERDEAQRILRKQTPLVDDAHVRFLVKQRIAVERELAETYALLNETRATMHAAHRALAGALSWASAGVAPPDSSAILRASEAVAASVDASDQRYAAHVARGSNGDSGA